MSSLWGVEVHHLNCLSLDPWLGPGGGGGGVRAGAGGEEEAEEERRLGEGLAGADRGLEAVPLLHGLVLRQPGHRDEELADDLVFCALSEGLFVVL